MDYSSGSNTDTETPLDEETYNFILSSGTLSNLSEFIASVDSLTVDRSPSPAASTSRPPSAVPTMGWDNTAAVQAAAVAEAPMPQDWAAMIENGGPRAAQNPTGVMPQAQAQTSLPPPMPSDAPINSAGLPYVLPHAPPPVAVPVASPVQPPGDRFVESAINNAIPALEAWAGVHGFRVTVSTPPGAQSVRQQPYVFDAEANKLYVDMCIPVMFTFRVSDGTDTSRLRVSALPVYPDMHHVNTPVRRCPTHRQPEMDCNAGAEGHVDHVIRAEHQHAVYQESGTTKERRSVVVPYEAPQPGTDEYRVSYRFCCMNTCVGGINRRRLVVLFTLEDNSLGTPLGRQTIEVKVCKCPHRDARTDSERRRRPADERGPARPPKRRLEPAREVTEPAARRPRSAGRLVIEVNDLEEFDHLTAVLKSFREVRRRSQPRPPPAALPPPPQAGRQGEDAERAGSEERGPPAGHRWATLPTVKTEIL